MTSGECCMPYIPNAFTPNGDGKNDIFRPVFKGNMKLIMFQVFNRFGELVYETDQLGKGWDGYYKGELSDMDTYFFHVKFICGQDGKEQYIKGDVTLIR
jgi:gliding motility-associated-like protein